jgi:hypothetical protein
MFNLYEATISAEYQRKEYMRDAANRRLVHQLRQPARAFNLSRLSLQKFLSVQAKEEDRSAALVQRSEAW